MSIYDLTINELEEYFLSKNDKKFRAMQVFDWLYIKRIKDFKEMKNISHEMISNLECDFFLDNIKITQKEISTDVVKYLFTLFDNEKIEAVVMNHDYRISLCISSQVGCNMGCKFCESGRLKKVRNLNPSEMVLQILKIEADLNIKITHIVIMGIGEPFDNFDNLKKFISIINHPKGINIGARHITISTCGIVDKILALIDFPYQVNLAISLHAPNDEIRNSIMPINKVHNIKDVIDSVKQYINATNRRVTFEYVMLEGINDSKECALELSKLLRGINAYVNIIPYNETNNIIYKRSSKTKILEFYDILKQNKITTTIRKEFGSNISAACGQLRSKKEEV
ncbi:MAG: 23S rRNA (adenine(2503)-C(2))-methyltransferase RlmN [Bacilli bacterium]